MTVAGRGREGCGKVKGQREGGRKGGTEGRERKGWRDCGRPGKEEQTDGERMEDWEGGTEGGRYELAGGWMDGRRAGQPPERRRERGRRSRGGEGGRLGG